VAYPFPELQYIRKIIIKIETFSVGAVAGVVGIFPVFCIVAILLKEMVLNFVFSVKDAADLYRPSLIFD
jgi:hypothetical protein